MRECWKRLRSAVPTYLLEIVAEGKDEGATTVMNGLGGSMKAVGLAAGALVAGGLGLLAKSFSDSIGVAKEFGLTMSGLQAVSQATAGDMNLLSDAAMRIGKDTSFGASDATAAMEMLSANGLQVTEILGGAADATVNLAAATGLKGQGGLTTAANVATDAMMVFGIQADEMSKAINGISGVTVASKFDINDYALAMAQGGGVAAAVGVEFEDFNTSIAGISNLFSSGSDAGTSFKVMLQRLVPASNPAEDAMRELGIITLNTAKAAEALGLSSSASYADINAAAQDYISKTQGIEKGSDKMGEALTKFLNPYKTNQFFDANGQMKSMAEISGILQGALSGLSEEKKNDALSTIFGTDAMRAAVGLAKLGEKGFTDLAASIDKVDASEQARIRLDNLAGDLEALSGTLETINIQKGMAFTPLLRDIVQTMNQFASTHFMDRDWSPMVNGLTRAWEGFKELAQYIGVVTSAVREGGWSALFTTFEDGSSYIAGFAERLGVAEGAAQRLSASFNAFVGVIQSGATSLQTAFTDGGALGVLRQLGTWLQPGLEDAQQRVAIFFATLTTLTVERMGQWKDGLIASVQASLPQWRAAMTDYATASWQ